MIKCGTCKHKNTERWKVPCYRCSHYDKSSNNDCYTPMNRYEKFREDTATIDGIIQWLHENMESSRICEDMCSISLTKCRPNYDCEAGIKAYWESEV